MLERLVGLVGGSNERVVRRMREQVEKEINPLEPAARQLTDAGLAAKTPELRARLGAGESLDDVLPEAFAVVREVARRKLGQRHFDVQLIGGIVLHQGKIAEMKTGEGKTLVATLPVYLNALAGEGAHLVTVNDYLARRDAQWMGPIYHALGLSIGVLQHESAYLYDPDAGGEQRSFERLRLVARADAYRADITYGTNNEFGFDYLRDNMVGDLSQRVQRPLAYAIVDEVDNILIDEARTPLIISGPAEASPREYQRFARLVPQLTPGTDFVVDEKHRTVSLTPEGTEKVEVFLDVKNLYTPENFGLVHFAENALKAHAVFHRDRDYVVKEGEVVIVDEFTGRLMPGRRWSDGVHQALEAKEGVRVQRESITYATITLQNYFRMYPKLAGMTGTAATEAEEFNKIYKLEVVTVPTHRPMIRRDHSDLIYRDEKAKFRAVVADIAERHSKGQPTLVGTTDITNSEALSAMLQVNGIPHEVLNAKQHEREALIVAQAGRPGAVTVATNMAGRGTDIILGGNPDGLGMSPAEWEADHQRVVDAGGLHIIGTERHDARRIDNQLRGRSGRQGDPGSSRFYVALDDDLMRRFGGDRIKGFMDWAGLGEDVPIENRIVSKSIEGAQVKVESYHFDIRKHLVDYDDVVNTHRDVVYAERDKILRGADLKANVQAMVERELSDIVAASAGDGAPRGRDMERLGRELSAIIPLPPDLSSPERLGDLSPEELPKRVLEQAGAVYAQREEEMGPEVMRVVERQLMLRVIDGHWVHHLTAIENLRQGIGLHAYGQRDPLVMYKKEAHEMFQGLMERIQRDIVHTIFHLSVVQDGRRGAAASPSAGETVMSKALGPRGREAVAAGARKVGRNEPCPCGSGKKYKRCHGA